MEVDDEAVCRKQLEVLQKEITTEMRDLEDLENMDEDIKNVPKETWQTAGDDLVPEKKSTQQLQSLEESTEYVCLPPKKGKD